MTNKPLTTEALMKLLAECQTGIKADWERCRVVLQEEVDNGVGIQTYEVPIVDVYISYSRVGEALLCFSTEHDR